MTTKKKTKLVPTSEPATQSLLPSAEFPIVGIGASAGGLGALAVFLANLYGRDITKRKRAEEELRASEAKFRGLFE